MIKRHRLTPSLASLIALLGLLAVGCRPLTEPVAGCENGEAACVPDVPGSSPSATLTPALPDDITQAAVSGRYLELVAKVVNPSAARELELLCGDRRLATWSISATGETATVGAVVDLLPCWSGITASGTSEPFGLHLVLVDLLDARHVQPTVYVRMDPRLDEGLGESTGGVWPFLLLSEPRADGSFHLQVDQALGGPPEVSVEGVRAEVAGLPNGWLIRPPELPGLDPQGALRGREFSASIQVVATGLTGRTTRLEHEFTATRDLRPPVLLRGDVGAHFIPVAASPVATAEGLLALSDDPLEYGRALQVLVRPDGSVGELEFPLEPGLAFGSSGCRSPDEGFTTGVCPLALSAGGQLLARDGATGNLLLLGPLSPPAPPALRTLSDPSPWSRQTRWARVGEAHVCTEGRTERRETCPGDCSPLRAPRVCIASDGSITSTPPSGPAELSAGSSSEVLGTGGLLVTRNHVPDLRSDLTVAPAPALGFGPPGGAHRWLAPAELDWPTTKLVAAGQQLAILNPAEAPSFLASLTGPLQPYAFHQTPYTVSTVGQAAAVDEAGRVITIGTAPDGRAVLSRWAPGSDQAEARVTFSLNFVYSWQLAEYEASPELARPLPGGGAVMVIRMREWIDDDAGWLVLAVDGGLRPLWSSFTQTFQPPLPLPDPERRLVWLVEPGAESLVRFMPMPR